MNPQEIPFMQRALELAERGRGHVEPNPLVGAVIVCAGKIVGEGWHQRFGGPHAEVHALEAAGELARGATIYVTLEPCCHFGKTPPCTDTLTRAGVSRVVAALADPFPEVAGQGATRLRAAGITVDFGPGEAEARRQNAPYLKLLATRLPYVHLKWAMTLDGKIATRTGDSKWISNEASRRRVHELRGCMDAIIVGIGTVLADDPLLTARPPGPRTPLRVVLDRRGRLPVDSQLVKTLDQAPVLVVSREERPDLKRAGCEVLVANLDGLLKELGRRRFTNVLVEGGSAVLGSFVDARAVDEVHVFIAPRLAGGAGITAIGGEGVAKMQEALTFSNWHMEGIEGDVYWRGWR